MRAFPRTIGSSYSIQQFSVTQSLRLLQPFHRDWASDNSDVSTRTSGDLAEHPECMGSGKPIQQQRKRTPHVVQTISGLERQEYALHVLRQLDSSRIAFLFGLQKAEKMIGTSPDPLGA